MSQPSRTPSPEKSPAPESQVDRLIALATNPAPPVPSGRPEQALALEEPHEPESKSLWKSLGQLKGALPYLSRLLPLLDSRLLPVLEMLGVGSPQNNALTKEMREHQANLEAAQRGIVRAIQDQALDLKSIEEQMLQLRDASDRRAHEHAELVAEVKSVRSLVSFVGISLAVLLVILIVLTGVLLSRFVR